MEPSSRKLQWGAAGVYCCAGKWLTAAVWNRPKTNHLQVRTASSLYCCLYQPDSCLKWDAACGHIFILHHVGLWLGHSGCTATKLLVVAYAAEARPITAPCTQLAVFSCSCSCCCCCCFCLCSRLFGCTTMEQLDAAYAAEVAASYSGMLAQVQQLDEAAQQRVAEQWQHYQQQLSKTAVWNIMMRVSSSSSVCVEQPAQHWAGFMLHCWGWLGPIRG